MTGIPNFDSLFRLDGKVAFITGGSRGLGFDIAAAFLQAGASKVIINARKEAGLQRAAQDLNSIPNVRGRASFIAGNVNTMESVEKLVAAVKEEVPRGRLHILVNNAGASWGGSFEDYEDWKTAKTFDVNVRGPFNLTRKLVPLLAAAGTPSDPARVIIISSVGGIAVTHVGRDGAIAYSISKAAMHHFGRNLALELAPKNITTNVIAPGWFPTRLANPAIEKYGGLDAASADNPMGRLGLREDIAGTAVYLCSKAGAYVNGEDITLDGGKRLLGGNSNSHQTDAKRIARL
ncbi:uncharacterized protein Z519_08597 [Cladophialophora bantiana CBS 173.52]|uniref:Ketoreductase domain-containing protein n=1 Tax=Cladophialophora bantiana (strain ATCC 10958 / CBS 173.52 / CDC B-1940 / NIH 8579) TaxID=1442370 RepID=A0A0D2I1M8_CLAB1|nr:uncharacterized protein Z519_08597 [Cladophialophora bantiana CBS 173.52]KIW90814.1 hypothetical protein Z519_08597 [Cladophialophora bantiana CBS 173.52]